ncbi:MAG: hypothetical protein SOW01_04460, partial [Mediterranea sp.]|nr:hypothetical protein [Mediterranea sp.]
MSQELQLPVYTYEFIPLEKPEGNLFQSKEEIEKHIEDLKLHKQEILQKYIDRIVKGELVPRMGDKEYRCKTLFHEGGVTIFKMENIKDESYDWNFGVERHRIGPNCHVIIDNRKDMQHIAIERKIKAFSSTNVVKNILCETLKPLLKSEGLLLEINPQFHPKEFWDFIEANRQYGIKEIRFYFPYPNLPAISDKYGEAMKRIGLDYHCMPGLILFAPDDLDMVLEHEDQVLNFWLEASSESGIPVAVQSKRMGSRMQLIGKNKCVTWPLDKKVLDMLDPQPEMAQQQQLLIDVLDTDEK